MPENLSLCGCGDLVSKSMCSFCGFKLLQALLWERLRKVQQHHLFTSALAALRAAFGEEPASPQSGGAAPLWDVCSLPLLLCK